MKVKQMCCGLPGLIALIFYPALYAHPQRTLHTRERKALWQSTEEQNIQTIVFREEIVRAHLESSDVCFLGILKDKKVSNPNPKIMQQLRGKKSSIQPYSQLARFDIAWRKHHLTKNPDQQFVPDVLITIDSIKWTKDNQVDIKAACKYSPFGDPGSYTEVYYHLVHQTKGWIIKSKKRGAAAG